MVNRKLQEKSIAVSKARGAEHKVRVGTIKEARPLSLTPFSRPKLAPPRSVQFPALSQVSLPVPKAFKRPALARTSVSLNAGRDDEDETYSETPMHVRAAQALVRQTPPNPP